MGHKTHTVTGNVQSVDHVGSSLYGNPIMRVTLTNGESYKTSVNAGIAYAASNFRPHSLRMPVSPVVLTLTDHDRIVDMKRPSLMVEGFQVTETLHEECDKCLNMARRAISMARVTGSVGGTHEEGVSTPGGLTIDHRATVRRVQA